MFSPNLKVAVAGLGNPCAQRLSYELTNADACLGLYDDGLVGSSVNGVEISPLSRLSKLKSWSLVVVPIFNPSSADIVVRKVLGSSMRPILAEEFIIASNMSRSLIGFPAEDEVLGLLDVRKYFNDSLSLSTIEAIEQYWLSGCRGSLFNVTQSIKSIYFNEYFLPRNPSHVYVDIGAYDGDTFIAACENFGGVSEAHLIEPVAQLDERDFGENVFVHKVALGSQKGKMRFCDRGLNSSYDYSGKIIVDQQCLDDLDISPSFVKIDAEGADIEVLRGASSTIDEHKPVLAISVYHYPSHLKEALELLFTKHGYTEFYLRKYSPSNEETVLYAVS